MYATVVRRQDSDRSSLRQVLMGELRMSHAARRRWQMPRPLTSNLTPDEADGEATAAHKMCRNTRAAFHAAISGCREWVAAPARARDMVVVAHASMTVDRARARKPVCFCTGRASTSARKYDGGARVAEQHSRHSRYATGAANQHHEASGGSLGLVPAPAKAKVSAATMRTAVSATATAALEVS